MTKTDMQMPTRHALFFMLIWTASCSQAPVHESAGAPLSEKEKIEKLISVVANMEGVQFIRKGVAYNCDVAAQFMRGKWSWKSSEVKTARDFVRICSAGNSGEGPPYFIRYADGTQVPTKVFLTEQLDKLEASASAQSSQ